MFGAVPIGSGNRGLTWRGVGERGGGRSEVLSLLHTRVRKTSLCVFETKGSIRFMLRGPRFTSGGYSPEGAAAVTFPGLFFSGESLGLCCHSCPALLSLWLEAFRTGKPDWDFLQLWDVLGKFLSFLDDSEDLMFVLGFNSSSSPVFVEVLVVELETCEEKAAVCLSVEEWGGVYCPESPV